MIYSQQIPVSGGELFCEITDFDRIDDGRPIVFVLPGGPGFNLDLYKNNRAISAFSQLAHLVFFDPANCGKSRGFNDKECDIDKYIDDVEAIRAHLNFECITLLGTSYGSMGAIGYAIKYPNKLNGLILVAGAPSYHFLDKAKENLNKIGTPEQIDFCNQYLWPGQFTSSAHTKEFFALMASAYSCRVRADASCSPYKNDAYDFPYQLLNLSFGSNFWHFDYTEELKNIKAKTLIIFGEHDWINDPVFAEKMAEEIPDSTLHIVKNAGHSVSFDATDEYRLYISTFIKKLFNNSRNMLE